MEYKSMPVLVLTIILVGMIVGVGVLTLDKFATGTKESTNVVNESFTVPNQNATVTLAKGENMTSFSYVLNASGDTWNSSQYSVDTSTGTLNNTGNTQECLNSSTCYAYYVYNEYNTDAATALGNSRAAVGDVSNTWMSLIVTIAILSLIIGLVIAGFYYGGRR